MLERYSPKPAESESNLPRPQSCTSEKKTWGPRKRDVTPKTVMSTTVERAKESEEHRKLPLKCTLYEARSDVAKNMSAADIITFKRLLHGECRLFSVLPEDSAEIEYVETSYGTAPKGSLLSYQLSLKRKPENQTCGISKKQKPTLSLPPETIALYKRRQEEGHDIPDSQYNAWLEAQLRNDASGSDSIVQKLPLRKHVSGTLTPTKRISLEESQQIEQATIGQHTSVVWKEYHTRIITSSNFRIICKCREVTDNFIRWLFHPPDISHIPAIQHGRQFEPMLQMLTEVLNWHW